MITLFFFIWLSSSIWLQTLAVPVSAQPSTGDEGEADSHTLQTYLVAVLVLLIVVLLVCVAAICGVALIYFKLNQIRKILLEKDDGTYAQIDSNLGHFVQVQKDQKCSSGTNVDVKGNSSRGAEEINNVCNERSSRRSSLKIPTGTVRATSFEFYNETSVDVKFRKASPADVLKNSQAMEKTPKYPSPPSYGNATRSSSRSTVHRVEKKDGSHDIGAQRLRVNSQANGLQDPSEVRAYNLAENISSVIIRPNQKRVQHCKTEPRDHGATAEDFGNPKQSSVDHYASNSSIYAIYDVPRPCSCSSLSVGCQGLPLPPSTTASHHEPLKRCLSEMSSSAFKLSHDVHQDSKCPVSRPVTFPSHENYDTEFKNLKESSSKDSGVASYVDSQLLDLIPEGNEPHIDSANELESVERQQSDKDLGGDKSLFI
eukprot:gi/632948544/ref/XP_007889656.1/ PREDICTED: uncharacterized protein LOC103177341 [Callorhinchus milii]